MSEEGLQSKIPRSPAVTKLMEVVRRAAVIGRVHVDEQKQSPMYGQVDGFEAAGKWKSVAEEIDTILEGVGQNLTHTLARWIGRIDGIRVEVIMWRETPSSMHLKIGVEVRRAPTRR